MALPGRKPQQLQRGYTFSRQNIYAATNPRYPAAKEIAARINIVVYKEPRF
ncbi:uncharacterized protein CLUP02_02179 [Colletotrichum lupini]|uniref:Uncharacterized protein n=1 Tax=Colletotrichum lupini TaxID=145971 RepID=A0A9Q8SE41_9PEZI|nr:uncharacterized protein CLUP02_02179 [Colletotrichum lupini]UQC75525.1 hypothetical protein CLUP02_02179 [Colletotrichum lupini]